MSTTKTKKSKTPEKAVKPKAEELVPAVKAARPTEAETASRLAVMRAQMEKQYGVGIVQNLAAEVSNQRFGYQIPTGSVSLDMALAPVMRRPDGSWQTGVTPGRIMEVFGPEGCGKTTLLGHLCANAQRAGQRCAYNDMEHQVDPTYFKRLGVNLSTLEFTQPSSGDDCMNIGILQLKSGLFDWIFFDSVAAMVPQSELDGEVGDAQMGAHARLMSQSMRIINSHLSTTKGVTTNIVFVNQIRNKIGVLYGNPETTTGGNALKFFSSVRIDMRAVGDRLKNGENVYGQRVRAKVIKNKLAPPFRSCEFDLVFGEGIDIHADLFDVCVGRGIITGAVWYAYKKTTLGQGRANCILKLKASPDLAYHLYDDLLTQVQDERGFLPDGTPIPGRVQEVVVQQTEQIFVPPTDAEIDKAVAAEDVKGIEVVNAPAAA